MQDSMLQQHHSQEEVELAKEIYRSRRSDAFEALSSWFSYRCSMDEGDHYRGVPSAEHPSYVLADDTRMKLVDLVSQFEAGYQSLRIALRLKLEKALSISTKENHEEVINKFIMPMQKFIRDVKELSAGKLREGISIIEAFQRVHEGHPEYKTSLSYLMTTHAGIYRQITDKSLLAINGRDIDLLQYLEHIPLDSQSKEKMRQSMETAGFKSVFLA